MALPESDYRIYSCDDHMDLFNVPRDLWSKRAPAALRESVPHVVERDGTPLWLAGDQVIGLSGKPVGFQSALARAGLEDDIFRPSDPRKRLLDMERDGIHASIVYGPGALLGFPVADPQAKQLTLRAWNDWAAEEFNAYAPDRLSALPELPTHSPEAAVEELERVVRLGHRGACFHAFEVDLADRGWDRLWAAASAAGLPLSFHIGGGTSIDPRRGGWRIAGFAAVAPLQLDALLAVMVFAGALERHPGLKLVLAESGVGWLPYFVARMDATFEKHCVPNPSFSIRTRPSELFHRQVYATFEEEPLGPELIPLLGPDNFMWACDYPHPDSTWPESRKAIEHALGKLPREAVRKVTGDNCRQLYGLP